MGETERWEILMMGRMYDAEQAYEIGLCNLVVTDEEFESGGEPLGERARPAQPDLAEARQDGAERRG